MTRLFEILQSAGPLPTELKAWLPEHVKRQEVKKGQLLLRPGDVCQRIYFIEKGLFRGFDNSSGLDQTIWLMAEDNLMIAVSSFYRQTPAEEGIEALENSVVYSLSWQLLNHVYEKFSGFNFNGRRLTERYYTEIFVAMLRLRMKRSVDRYRSFEQSYPNLAGRVSGIHLSSYLGMSPDALYRARKKNRRKR